MNLRSDTILDVSLMALIIMYLAFNQTTGHAPAEAVLGQTSLIINDLEAELGRQGTSGGIVPAGLNLPQFFKSAKNTAIVGKKDDAALMPDITQTDGNIRLGGCPINANDWIILRVDQSALTGIPEQWVSPSLKLCLDRNGGKGPNKEGYDVIWLSMSRTSVPHITLLPVQSHVLNPVNQTQK